MMSETDKAAGKKAILDLLKLGMPIVENARPLDFRLSVANVVGAMGTKLTGSREFSNAFAFVMGYLSAATDEEIVAIMKESKAGSN